MKKTFLFLAFAAFAVAPAFSQRAPINTGQPQEMPKANGAQMKFVNETYDYGDVVKASNGEREFVFTNTGTEPLNISNAQGSCGCTVPTWPKEPILPNKTGVIKVKYDTNREGPFTKYITLTTNAPGQESLRLTIKGNVLKEGEAAPVKQGGMLNGGN